VLARTEEQVVDLPRFVQPFAIREDEDDSPQVAAGDGVGEFDELAQLQFVVALIGARVLGFFGQEVAPCDQFVAAHLGIPPNAERVHAKRFGKIIKPITYVG